MRNGQKQQRMRGRNRGKSHNPLSRLYESNGPDVKIRGTAHHIAEKYLQLARDAQSSGDPVGAENYYQHAEHYFRLIAAAQEQFRQSAPFYRPEGEAREEASMDEGEEAQVQGEPTGAREPFQPGYQPRETQPYGLREPQPYSGRPHQPPQGAGVEEPGQLDRLPSFITGGSQPQPGAQQQPYQGNGHDGGQGERFSHRRRRRHRGPRSDMAGGQRGTSAEAADDGPEPAGAPQND